MTIALIAQRLLTGCDGPPLHDQVVLIDQARIQAVGPRGTLALPPEAQIVDLGEGTLLPGLIDLHSHSTYYYRRADANELGRPGYSESMITMYALWNLQQALEAGITTVRDVGAVHRLAHEIERARTRGFVRVPRIYAAGKLITSTGGHVFDRPGLSNEADGVDGVRRAVREEIRAGARFIKIAINGADFLYPEIQATAARVNAAFNGVEFSQEELNAAVEETHRAGLKLACHTRWRPSVAKAIRAGADTIEHGTYMTDDDLRELTNKGIVWVPTIYQGYGLLQLRREWAQEPGAEEKLRNGVLAEESYRRRRDLFALALKLGTRMGLGTDIFRPDLDFASMVGELQMFVDFGMAPLDAIQAATRRNAEAMGWDGDIGSIEPGKAADLAFVAGDPVADLSILRWPKLVMLEGQIVVDRR